MKITMRSAAMAGALAVLLSACGESPTSSASIGPAGPSYDGGYGAGSGTRTAPADTSGSIPQSTTDSATAERGGYGVGSGG